MNKQKMKVPKAYFLDFDKNTSPQKSAIIHSIGYVGIYGDVTLPTTTNAANAPAIAPPIYAAQ